MVRAQNIWNCRELSRCRQIFGLFVKLVPPQCGDHTTKALNCPHLGFGHQAHQGEFYPPRWENWRVRWVWRVANGHLEQHSLSHMVHIIGCISYGPYNMDHFISLSHGSYHMVHIIIIIWAISYGPFHIIIIWTISAQDDGDGEWDEVGEPKRFSLLATPSLKASQISITKYQYL